MTKFNPVFSVVVTIVCTSNSPRKAQERVPPPRPRPQPLSCLGRALPGQRVGPASSQAWDVFDAADLRVGGAALEPGTLASLRDDIRQRPCYPGEGGAVTQRVGVACLRLPLAASAQARLAASLGSGLTH